MAVAIYTSLEQLFDNSGDPLNGGSVTVYAAGTTTPLALFSDPDLASPGHLTTNPVTLDSAGRHAMTYIATASYKVVVKNSANSTIYTRDNIDPGVAVGSGALAVASGGTGGTSAGAARTNLSVPSAAEVALITTDVGTLQTRVGSTGSTSIAKGTTAQRPGSPNVDDIRYNSTLVQYEAYDGVLAAFAKMPTVPVLGADMATNFLIGYTYAESTSNTALTGATPVDDTIPQISEGSQICALTTPIPQSTSSKFLLIFTSQIQNGNGDVEALFALHKTGQTDAIASRYVRMASVADALTVSMFYIDSPASSSAVTYSARLGSAAGISLYINGKSGGRLGGGSSRASLIAVEIKG